MVLQQAVLKVFQQLSSSIESLEKEEYSRACENLSGSTIGQHVRHIIEMFQCLEQGYESGIVNYESRKRDRQIEDQKELAIQLLNRISNGLNKPDKALILEGVYNDDPNMTMKFPTNYYREIVYNLEHAIHHMALIRVGLKDLKDVELPHDFGVASATVKYKRTCAQ